MKLKKYPIGKFYFGLYIFSLIFFALFFAFSLWAMREFDGDWASCLCLSVSVIGMVSPLYMMFVDFPLYFSVTTEAFLTYRSFKTYALPWSEVKYCGIVGTRAGNDYSIFEVYFSARPLTWEERNRFFNRVRYDMKNVAFFLYSPEVFQEILPMIPPNIARELTEKLSSLEENMTRFEKFIHR